MYWHSFKRRHPIIKTKKAVWFDSHRDDWCNVENFQKMYHLVYKAMVKSNVAIELEEEVFVRANGTITQDKAESVGRKTKFKLTQPEYVFFVDEVGCNTSQKSDGNVWGQKFVVIQEGRVLQKSSHQDCHFTVLGFTNAKGEPACCLIILAASEVTGKDIMGLQPWVEYFGDPAVNMAENSHGPEKYYPYGPTCNLNGNKYQQWLHAAPVVVLQVNYYDQS
jgi:hypothetical protein